MNRALIVAPSDGLGGGIERVISAYREALATEGLDVVLVALRRVRARRLELMSFVAECLWALWTRPDVVVVGHIGLAPIALLAAAVRPQSRRLLLIYGQDAWERRMRWRERVALRAVTVVSISEYTRSRFVRLSDAADDVLVIRPPVPLTTSPSATASSTIIDGVGDYVLCVTRMASNEPEKHIDWLLAGVALAHHRGWPGRLVVVGDGDDVGRLRALARSLGIGNVTSFLGKVDDHWLAELYARAALFALPSTQEGLGLVFMEAMAAGVPVLATDVGPAREIVTGAEGVLLPPGDVHAWADAIVSMTTDQGLRNQLGENGRQRAATEFGLVEFAGRLSAVLSGSRRGSGGAG